MGFNLIDNYKHYLALLQMNISYLIPIAGVVGYLLGKYRTSFKSKHLYQFQNFGEVIVRRALTTNFPEGSWHLLNNITLEYHNSTTQIDHVLVSRYGIFVIETKHYKGWIFCEEKAKEWTQVIYSWKNKFQNPLHQNYKHLRAVQESLNFLPPENILGLVIFTGEAEFMSPIPKGVHSVYTLVEYLKTLNTEVISENRMQFCIGRLE